MGWTFPWYSSFGTDFNYDFHVTQGAKPGDLPIEQPTRLELVVNMTTAKALELSIPDSILLRADELLR